MEVTHSFQVLFYTIFDQKEKSDIRLSKVPFHQWSEANLSGNIFDITSRKNYAAPNSNHAKVEKPRFSLRENQ